MRRPTSTLGLIRWTKLRDDVGEVDDLDEVADGGIVLTHGREALAVKLLETACRRCIATEDALEGPVSVEKAEWLSLTHDVDDAAFVRVGAGEPEEVDEEAVLADGFWASAPCDEPVRLGRVAGDRPAPIVALQAP